MAGWIKSDSPALIKGAHYHGDLHLALLDVEDRIRRISLREDGLCLSVLANGVTSPTLARKGFRIEFR